MTFGSVTAAYNWHVFDSFGVVVALRKDLFCLLELSDVGESMPDMSELPNELFSSYEMI